MRSARACKGGWLVLGTLLISTVGCSSATVQWQDRWGGASLTEQYIARDGATGARLDFARLASRAAGADVILFGEEHNHPTCTAIEAALFGELVRRGAAPKLAMEFFERDTQPALDAYLAGSSTEPDFRKAARQGKSYVHSHRPLIEVARAGRAPVIAANAPRTLVRELRKSGLAYDAFRASRSAEEQALLPERIYEADSGYRARFMEIMGGHAAAPSAPSTPTISSNHASDDVIVMQPVGAPSAGAATSSTQPATSAPSPELLNSMFNAQLLWDSAMAESVAKARERSGSRPVMLVVGRFHVEQLGGTTQALRALRPRDRVLTVVFRSDEQLPASAPEKGVADIVIDGLSVPPPPGAPQ
ncbi:MAG: ChaN family lipoprotein [Phycisphaerae bacterium]|nr:ChaN family lipoprotein [Phycisphaerae bacterium]